MEFRCSIENLSGLAGRKAGQEDLEKCIQILNANRTMLRKLFPLMKETELLDYSSFMCLVRASMLTLKEDINSLLQGMLQEFSEKAAPETATVKRPMVFLYGNLLEDGDLLTFFDKLPLKVQMGDSYNGTRFFLHEVDGNMDPLEALAQRNRNYHSRLFTRGEG